MSKRLKIIKELQERNSEIETQIQKLQQDWNFNLNIIKELNTIKDYIESDEELSE
jgi:cell division protein FtsB